MNRILLFSLLIVLTSLPCLAQRPDPLNDQEVDALRDTNQDSEKRLKLLVKFVRARLDSIDQAKADQKVAAEDRDEKIHDLLQNFLSIYDELGDNLDMYHERNDDMRKGLHEVIQGDGEFQARLERLRQTSAADELKQYDFVLSNAQDTVRSGSGEHKQLLTELDQAFAKKAKEKKK